MVLREALPDFGLVTSELGAITPSEGQRLVSVTRSSGSTRYLLGESHERKVFAFKLTNECWKTFSENYEES